MRLPTKEVVDTASFWLSVSGIAVALRKDLRHVAGYLLLLAGLGGIGVGWERATGSRLSGVRSLRSTPLTRADRDAVLWHIPLGVAGAVLVRKAYRCSADHASI